MVSDFSIYFSIVPQIDFEKKVFLKANLNKLSKKLFFQSTFKAQSEFFLKNQRPHFQNSFVSTFFYVFCARLQIGTQKSY